jgi:Uma2 family endonuclease
MRYAITITFIFLVPTMTVVAPPIISLAEFLALDYIDEAPHWEYIDGTIIQKPMGGGKHSTLQGYLVFKVTQLEGRYRAYPEFRCTFGGRSVVPDVIVLESSRIPVDDAGDVIDTGIEFSPDWVIEVLSPNQSHTKVTGNILHCMRQGCQLGWLIDPKERSVLVYQPDRLPDLLTGSDRLPVLAGVELELTAEDLFSSLRVQK